MTRAALIVLVIAILAPVASAELTPEQRRLVLDEALTAYDRGIEKLQRDPAGAQESFREAAERFELLIDDGVVNGPLLYNIGNARLQAGDIGLAIANYRRAEQFMPGDTRLERNVAHARSLPRIQIAPSGTRALTDALLSWHRDTPITARSIVFAVMYVLFWGLVAGFLFYRRSFWIYGAVLAAIVWIACGASIGFDVWGQETHPAGVVVADEVVVRKGNGEGFEPQLEQPLTEGVEFVVLEARDDWLMIELPDGNTGWIKASQAELI
jgi:hypothetical protein